MLFSKSHVSFFFVNESLFVVRIDTCFSISISRSGCSICLRGRLFIELNCSWLALTMSSAALVLKFNVLFLQVSSLPLFLFFFKFFTKVVQLSSVLLWFVAKLILTQRKYSMLFRLSLLLFVASLLDKTTVLIAEMGKLYESLQHLNVLILILACCQKILTFCFFLINLLDEWPDYFLLLLRKYILCYLQFAFQYVNFLCSLNLVLRVLFFKLFMEFLQLDEVYCHLSCIVATLKD